MESPALPSALPSALPPEIMGRIAAFADTGTRRAMIRGKVVALEDVLYQLPPETLPYTELKERAMMSALPNKYDSHLREVARALKAYILARNHGPGPFSKFKDKIYAAMAYHLLTDGTVGLKVQDIKGLDIGPYKYDLFGEAGKSLTKANKSVTALQGHILYLNFLTDGERHRTDGPSATVYTDATTLCIVYRIKGQLHRVKGPAVIHYQSGALLEEQYWTVQKQDRKDGPAVLYYAPDGAIIREEYWVDGRLMS